MPFYRCQIHAGGGACCGIDDALREGMIIFIIATIMATASPALGTSQPGSFSLLPIIEIFIGQIMHYTANNCQADLLAQGDKRENEI